MVFGGAKRPEFIDRVALMVYYENIGIWERMRGHIPNHALILPLQYGKLQQVRIYQQV